MSMTPFYIAGIVTPAGAINQIRSLDHDPQTQEFVEAVDGQVDPSFAAVMEHKPKHTFGSTALALVLAAVPLGGLAYTSAGSTVDSYWQPGALGGTRDTTNCVKHSSAQGMLCIQSIEASDGQPAEVTFETYPISADGISSPITMTSGVSLPAPLATRQYFTTGPVKINGTLIGGVKRISVRSGIVASHETESGNAYPTWASIDSRSPRMVITTTNVDQVATMGLFAAQSGTTGNGSKIFFRKMLSGSTRVPDATAQHVGLTMVSGMIFARRINGAKAMAEIELVPTINGTDPMIAVATATAIA